MRHNSIYPKHVYQRLAWNPKYDTIDLKIVGKTEPPSATSATGDDLRDINDNNHPLIVHLGNLQMSPSQSLTQASWQNMTTNSALRNRILNLIIENLKMHRDFHFMPSTVDSIKKQLDDHQKTNYNQESQTQPDTLLFSIKLLN